MISQKIINWLSKMKLKHQLNVKIINLDKINNWKVDKTEIHHITKKFFKIVGIKIFTNFYQRNWDQPIIIQNEVGILGIIKDPKTKKYLLQAKVEPGNINKIQLAPTVQATKSNYSGAHGGSKVPYIEHFLKLRNIEKYNQSEQGFRYLKKYNSNILIKNIKKIKKKENFYWFSKNEIKKLIYKKNMINMDTLSVLSSVLKKNNKDNPVNNKLKIVKWLKILDQRFYIKTQIVKLSVLKDWNFNSKNIVHRNKKHFSIIGVDVKASRREVNSWSQPIIQGKKTAFAGFLKSKINDTDHYLCRYIIKPGLKNSVIGCTINTSDISEFNKNSIFNKIEKKFYKEYFTLKKGKANIIFDNILSDEGGRFYQCQVRCMITSVNYKEVKNIPNNYMWLSYNQVNEMIKNKKVDIESRLLFVCNNIDQIQ